MLRFTLVVFILFLFLLSKEEGFAQTRISHEIGVLVGPASFLTDYGERYDIQNNLDNSGFGVGIVHYINFSRRADCSYHSVDRYFNDHFKIRNEIDYFRTDLEHIGPVAEKDNAGGKLLRGMHGKTETFEIGTHLEYYPLSIKNYSSFSYLFMPFISLGIHYVHYRPDAYSDFGPLSDPNNIFPAFEGGINLDSGSTWTLVGIAGSRYKISPLVDISLEGRFQYYDVDWIDGLNINAPQNKYNDVVFWLNFGFIYYLN